MLNSVKSFVESRHNDYVEDLMAEGQIDEGDEIPDEQLPIVTLGEFLEDISLLSSVDVDDEESANKIALMTVHSAKGLEFPYVYVSGMEENLFPSGGMMASPTDIEEERRLFYVALTRARKAVSLTYAVTRMRNGKHESNPPSRFLRELDPSCVQNPLKDDGGDSPSFSGLHHPGSSPWQAPLWKRPQTPASRLRPAESGPSSLGTCRPLQVQHKAPPAPVADFVPDSVLDLSEGCRVEHNRFGRGTVVQISGNSSDLKAVIDFDRYGRKILLLQYAKMRLVK